MKVLLGRIRSVNLLLVFLYFCYFVLHLLEDVNALPQPVAEENVAIGGGGRGGGGGGGGGGRGGRGGGGETGSGSSRSSGYRSDGYIYYHGGGSSGGSSRNKRNKGFFKGLAAGAVAGAATIVGLTMVLDHELTDPKQISKPLAELVELVTFLKQFKPTELTSLLANATCEAKAQWKDVTLSDDVSEIFGVKQSSIETVILVSMIDCPAALAHATRAKYYTGVFSTERLRDITEVMVTVSETAELHDEFIKDFEADTGSGPASLAFSLDVNEDIGLKGDVRHVCYELLNRKRITNADVNVQEAGQDLKSETTRGNGIKQTGWKDNRKMLDWIMMELSFEQILKILDEFKTANNGISIDDAFSDKMRDDIYKQTTYRQLLALARNKTAYLADEIYTRNQDNQEWSLPFGSAVSILGTLSKADRDKVDAEYKMKNNNVGLMEQLDKMLTTSGFEDIIVQVCKHYLENLQKRTQ